MSPSMTATAPSGRELAASQLRHEILNRLGGRIRGLEVILQQEGAVLRGHVRTFHVKQLAQQTVMEMGGVVLRNAIVVQ